VPFRYGTVRGNRDRFPGPGDKDGLGAAVHGDAPGQNPSEEKLDYFVSAGFGRPASRFR